MQAVEFELPPDELPPVRVWVEIDEAAGRLRGQQAPALWLQRGTIKKPPTRTVFEWRKVGGALTLTLTLTT